MHIICIIMIIITYRCSYSILCGLACVGCNYQCVSVALRLYSNPIASSRVPQVIGVSLQLCSGLGCDELETCLLSLGVPVERFH